MVSPDKPSPIKKVNPSPVKQVESFGGSPVSSMAEKLRMVRSIDCQAPAPMPSRETIEVRSFDDDSAVSSKISAFTDVLTRAGSVATAVGAAVATVGNGQRGLSLEDLYERFEESDAIRENSHKRKCLTGNPCGLFSEDSGSIFTLNISHTRRKWAVPSTESPLSALLSARSRSDDKLLPDPEESSLSPPSVSGDALSGSGSGIEAEAETVRIHRTGPRYCLRSFDTSMDPIPLADYQRWNSLSFKNREGSSASASGRNGGQGRYGDGQ